MERTENPVEVHNHNFEPLLTLKEAADLLGMHWKTLEVLLP